MSRTIHINEDQSQLWTSNLLNKETADELYTIFSSFDFPLIKDPTVIVYGKECTCHRRVGFFSDESEGYPFAGQTAASLPLSTHPKLKELLNMVNNMLGSKFNGILINHYVNGSDYIGAHRDDERTLWDGTVAAISLGSSRKFRIRRYDTKEIVMDLPTEHGGLLVMSGDFQKVFTHEIPVQKRISGGRVSLTFRQHV